MKSSAATVWSARDAAVRILTRVDAGDAFANVLLRSVLSRSSFSAPDAGLTTELVLGVLRHRARVDWTLEGALRQARADLPLRITAILRTGTYQLLFLPRIPHHAAVDEAVSLAHAHGHAGTAKLVNAVLRRIAAEGERPLPDGPPEGRIAIEFSHPRWLVERWLRRFGAEETVALCRANNEPTPMTVRVNTLRLSAVDAAQRLRDAGVTVTPTALPEGFQLHGPIGGRDRLIEAGALTIQDVGGMLVTHVLDPQPGETVIDGAAAPGGKTTHIAERMRNRGRVIACDVHPAKLVRLSARIAAMGIEIVEAHDQDARRLGRARAGAGDRLLLDLPCTGLGVVRRRPEIKWRLRPDHIATMAQTQRQILHGAADAVRPGGVLVYSVCSLEDEEGQAIVEEFLGTRRDFAPDLSVPLPQPLRARPAGRAGMLVLPHLHGTDGFYIARLRRQGH